MDARNASRSPQRCRRTGKAALVAGRSQASPPAGAGGANSAEPGRGRGGWGGASEPHRDPAAETSHVVSATVHLNCTCENQVECLNTIDQLRVPASLERSGAGSLSFTQGYRRPVGCSARVRGGVEYGWGGGAGGAAEGLDRNILGFSFFIFSCFFNLFF